MKYSIYIMMMMSLSLYGCAQNELMDGQEEKQEVYTVSLNLSGDIKAEESPLSRSDSKSKDLYGIQVYKDDKYFAAGMFTKTDNIKINLLADGIYKFVCSAVKNGQDKCYYSESGGYGHHRSGNHVFRVDNYNGDHLWLNRNSFIYLETSAYQLSYLDHSGLLDSSCTQTYNADVDRFYGEFDNYTPSVNGAVNLELKRVSFGFKLQITNIKEGKVSATCKNSNRTFASATDLTDDYETESAVYSMSNIYDAWKYASTGYTEPLTLTVTWEREAGISDTWTKTVQMKRNAMNTIRIKMSTDEKGDTGVGIESENGEMRNEGQEIPLK